MDVGDVGTYKAWQRHGCQVRRGEHATSVVLWKEVRRDRNEEENREQRGLFATTFAAEQVKGSDALIAARNQLGESPDRLADAERYFAAVGANVSEAGSRAFYQSRDDRIVVPPLAQFGTAEHFCATLAHEHVHWTGAEHRLNRDMPGRFGDDAYAAEELVAELGAAFWCGQSGIGAATRDDHTSYLAGWLKILRSDARALVSVSSRAQHAVDFLNRAAGYEDEAPGLVNAAV